MSNRSTSYLSFFHLGYSYLAQKTSYTSVYLLVAALNLTLLWAAKTYPYYSAYT